MATAPSGKKGRGKNSVIHTPGDAGAETAIGQQVSNRAAGDHRNRRSHGRRTDECASSDAAPHAMKNDRFPYRSGRRTEILKLVLRQRTIHPQIDDRSVIMLLSTHAIRNQK
jgi:hypothetical protein